MTSCPDHTEGNNAQHFQGGKQINDQPLTMIRKKRESGKIRSGVMRGKQTKKTEIQIRKYSSNLT